MCCVQVCVHERERERGREGGGRERERERTVICTVQPLFQPFSDSGSETSLVRKKASPWSRLSLMLMHVAITSLAQDLASTVTEIEGVH